MMVTSFNGPVYISVNDMNRIQFEIKKNQFHSNLPTSDVIETISQRSVVSEKALNDAVPLQVLASDPITGRINKRRSSWQLKALID